MITEKKKILVVEDELSMRSALRDKLTREGFLVIEAKNGEEGFEVALREHPDLILLDIVMPRMDGITTLRKLRNENEYGKHVPIIILTNLTPADEERNLAIAEFEPAYYLVKTDWTLEDVIEKIRERLNRDEQTTTQN